LSSVGKVRRLHIPALSVAVLTVLLLICFASTSLADTTATSTGNTEIGALPGEETVPSVTNPDLAEELPHEKLERPEVIALLKGVFEPVLQAAAGPFDNLEVERFISQNAAIVDGSTALADEAGAVVGGGPPPNDGSTRLIESTFPIKQDGEEVDLSLIPGLETLSPVNPLVDVRIPQELGDGIELPEGDIRVLLPGVAGERTPSIVENTAIYPNIARNSDVVVAPTPTGFETLTQLRSEDAPRSQTFKIEAAADAELKAEKGGAILSRGETVLLRIPQPTAIDAEGHSVEVDLKVGGDSLMVTALPDSDTQWPVLVDPLFEYYQWMGNHYLACDEFELTVSPLRPFQTSCGDRWGSYVDRGLGMGAFAGTFTPNWAKWDHSVPRLRSEATQGLKPTSFIASMALSNVHVVTSGGPSSPYALAGIWDGALQDWAGVAPSKAVWGYPGNAAPLSNGTITFTNGNSHEAKTGVVTSLAVNEPSATSTGFREMFVSGVTFEVGDVGLPEVQFASGSGWVDGQGASQVEVSATIRDTGLGAKRADFTVPGQGTITAQHGCAGSVAAPCPRTWVAKLLPSQFNPSALPQGENAISIWGQDVLGQKSVSAAKALVRVDRTAPELAVSGNLTDQSSAGTHLSEYTLNYSASDGDDAAAAALTPFGSPGTGSGQLERPQGVAVDSEGNVWITDRINNRVVAYDKTGSFLRQIGTPGTGDGQINEPRGIAVAPNGNIWVAEAGTNKRVQQFTPTGTFVSKVTNAGFVEPWGIAFGPKGEMWVTDQSGKALVFLAGVYLKTISGPLGVPYGVDVDRFGNAWIALQSTHKVAQVTPEGALLRTFGTYGTGPGQFQHPSDIAIAESGNILVTDDLNNRVQVFKSDGSFLRQFGSVGGGSGQFNQPRGIDVGPGNSAVIADSGNKRVARWSHADQDPQSGAAKVEIKVDGASVKNQAPGCATKNCAISGSWSLDVNDFSAGQHKVEVIATDGVGLSTTKTLQVETHGDLQAPTIALSGSMTQQATLGTTRPIYALGVKATDPGLPEERKSGVAATTIEVDGKVVDSVSPGCPAGGCSIVREWKLDSSSYAVGPHTVKVTATDAVGRSTTKTLEINIARDTTAPTFELENAFYTAPEGWLEQKTYNYNARALDPDGYGVTSMTLKIDGNVVKSVSGSCQGGGCSKSFGFAGIGVEIDMSKYDGGAHPAELTATDGAGNTRKRSWTINVTPKGQVPPMESTNTLEAMEETVPAKEWFLPVAPTSEFLEPQIIEAGANPHLKEEGNQIVSTGVTVDTTVDSKSGAVSIEGTEGELEVVPQDPTLESVIAANSAAVLSGTNVDTVIRPEYNGAYMFKSIRDAAASETYEWSVKLPSDQHLVQANPEQLEVKWSNGETAFLITAEPAHDATGKAVPTTLSVTGLSSFAINVSHRNGGYVYPVAAGQSYETGYATVTVYFPEESAEEEEALEPMTPEEEADLNADVVNGFSMPDPWNGPGAQRSRNKPITRKQAKRIMRVKRQGRTVPAPSASASGGPGSCCSEVFTYPETAGRVYSAFNDEIWDVEIQDGTFALGRKYVKFNPDNEPKCDDDVLWYWKLNLAISNQSEPDHLGPGIAYRGGGQHLTFRCLYTVFMGPVPVENVMEASNELQLRIYPNGYQNSVAKENNWKLVNKVW
jgi:6-bladed beta-propeller/NHL repeat